MTAAGASTPPRWRRWARATGQLVALLVFYLGLRAVTQRGVARGAAPALAGHDLAGHAVSLADLRGKPVVVHFWATWCPVCMAESSTVDALAHDHDVVTVATSSGAAAQIQASMRGHGLSFPVVVDEDGDLARAWGVRAFPTSFFLDADQRIRFAETGFTTSPGFRARLWLAAR